jgi:Rhodopirellula transposase DDE domain
MVDFISNTTTTTGLTVHCVLDTDQYPTGIRYTAKDVAALHLADSELVLARLFGCGSRDYGRVALRQRKGHCPASVLDPFGG